MRTAESRLFYFPPGHVKTFSFAKNLLSKIFRFWNHRKVNGDPGNRLAIANKVQDFISKLPLFAFSESSDSADSDNKQGAVDRSLASSKAAKIFDIVQKAFEEVLGEAAGKGLASRLSPSMVSDPQKLEKELRRLLGYGADIIIDAVRAMLSAAHISLPLASSLPSSSNLVKVMGDEGKTRTKRNNGENDDENPGKTQFMGRNFISRFSLSGILTSINFAKGGVSFV